MSSTEAFAAIAAWRRESDPVRKKELFEELLRSGVYSVPDEDKWETYAGLYPDVSADDFLQKLMKKIEFLETRQPSVKEQMEAGEDPCHGKEDFELTPTQRFVSKFLSPHTPYNGALLYHGVGVGKTCAAVITCESYLELYPDRKAMIVCPPNIKAGFLRNIFDADVQSLTIGKAEGEPNKHNGCTGNLYMRLTNTLYERDREKIRRAVNELVNRRYMFFGYYAFYKYIVKKQEKFNLKDKPKAVADSIFRQLLQGEFNNRVLVIDEAHNLRDVLEGAVGAEGEEDDLDDASIQDKEDSKAAKKLTPMLIKVLESTENLKLVLMTATPMYNNYTEIIFLLNLLLTNDKAPLLRKSDIFNLSQQTFTDQGKELLGAVAHRYVSYMRGENPLRFPLRIEPQAASRVSSWPRISINRKPIGPSERADCAKLYCVGCSFEPEAETRYEKFVDDLAGGEEGLSVTVLDNLVAAGNWMYPSEDDDDIYGQIQIEGFSRVFTLERPEVEHSEGEKTEESSYSFYTVNPNIGADWLLEKNLLRYSAKCARVLERLKNCRGVAFVYSRFVSNGALSIALALEANGYTAHGREKGFLKEGVQHPEGRQCALCPRHEKGHGLVPEEKGVAAHTFKPAKYVLLTADKNLSPNNAASVRAIRKRSNLYGEDIKVVLGSQVAGEGLDLKYVREIMVFDSWYHLNKLEQIVGRGIRNCSHADLPASKRNCTVTLLVNQYKRNYIKETVDMYSYRMALRKAQTVGMVTRTLKEYALDCALNKDAIQISGLKPLPMIYDSQGEIREEVPLNDLPLTPLCDWGECTYECLIKKDKPLVLKDEDRNTSTYDEYTARYEKTKLRDVLKEIFETSGQAFTTFENIEAILPLPKPVLTGLLQEIVDDPTFTIQTADGREGRVLHRESYYFFQPSKIKDTHIPTAVRLAQIPVKRDRFIAKAKEIEVPVLREADTEDTEALWNAAIEWTDTLREGTADEEDVPTGFMNEVTALPISAGIKGVQEEKFEMILWMYRNMLYDSDMVEEKVKDPEALGIFADCVLDYIWDEFMSTATKRQMIGDSVAGDVLQTTVAKESFWDYEGKVFLRLVNGEENTIEYLNASEAERQVLEEEVDPLVSEPINTKTTGKFYGFVLHNPKKKQLVFKYAAAPGEGKKVLRGKECVNDSETKTKFEMLEEINKQLVASKQVSVNFSFSKIEDRVEIMKVRNSVRICTMLDMVFRFMDKAGIQKKRWFYRPLEAKLHGHPLR